MATERKPTRKEVRVALGRISPMCIQGGGGEKIIQFAEDDILAEIAASLGTSPSLIAGMVEFSVSNKGGILTPMVTTIQPI